MLNRSDTGPLVRRVMQVMIIEIQVVKVVVVVMKQSETHTGEIPTHLIVIWILILGLIG